MDIQNLKITVGQMRNLLLAMMQVEERVDDQRYVQWSNGLQTNDSTLRSKKRKQAKTN
jgi:hypothetical protein